jgi:hypothetical protein
MSRRDGSRWISAWTWPGIVLAATCSTFAGRASADEFAPRSSTLDVSQAASDDLPQVIPVAQPTPAPTAPKAPSVKPGPATPTPSGPSPSDNTPPPETTTELPSDTLLAYSLASVPDMIGDTLGGRYRVQLGTFGNHVISDPLAGGDRLAKIADDSNPIPTDRVFFGENYFNHAVQTANGAIVGLNQVTFGFEKTFNDGLWSIEVRAPLDGGLSDTQNSEASTSQNQGTVFGNLTITPKILIYKDCEFAASVGLMIDLPTAPNCDLTFPPVAMEIQNNAVYLEPFFGFVYAPNPCLFAIGYVQLDFDPSGDQVNVQEGSDPLAGTLRDPSLLYVDLSVGRWLFHDDCDCCRGALLTGIAPVVELHYTTGLTNASSAGNLIVPVNERCDYLDLTAGAYFEFGHCSTLALAASVPLEESQRNRQFDSEIIAEFNRRF